MSLQNAHSGKLTQVSGIAAMAYGHGLVSLSFSLKDNSPFGLSGRGKPARLTLRHLMRAERFNPELPVDKPLLDQADPGRKNPVK